MPTQQLPTIPFGAVYFRKSNPPRADWERDYQTAAADGMTAFRHWFMWSAVEIAPGVYDWEEYDRHLELAAANGIKTIIAEMVTAAPEWAFRKYAHARMETREGQKMVSSMSHSCATGGWPGLCLDNEDVKAEAEKFLRAMATRYKGHPGLGGWDIWNEIHAPNNICYCPATAQKFREWLKNKYGDLRTLGQVWQRHSFAEWEDVTPPRVHGPYPDTLDWFEFRIDNAFRLMHWRAEVVRSVDPDCAITSHSQAATFGRKIDNSTDDWRGASETEIHGITYGSCRHGDEPWKQATAFDMVRAAARGKSFWHAEAYAGPLWMQSVMGKPRNEGRIPSPEDVRYWNMTSFMYGARGLFFLRWRPVLDGPLFGAFGPYGMDGSRTPRSEMVSKQAKWVTAPEQEKLWQSRPVKGDIGIIYAPETEFFTVAQQGNAAFYADSMDGAYRGFFDNNIQADWVHIDDITGYKLLYLPFPVMLSQKTVAKLHAWVEAGGTLISEGTPAYFGDHGHVGMVQPNYGLDEVFGAREKYVEFTPDLLTDLSLNVKGLPVWGGIFMQAYQPTTGTAVGWYDDGRVAAVENHFGKGHTLLIGSMPGWGYGAHAGRTPYPAAAPFFAGLVAFGGAGQHVQCMEPRVKVRLHAGPGGVYLWVANPIRQSLPVHLELGPAWGPFTCATSLWAGSATVAGRTIDVTAPGRDVTVLKLE